MSTEAEFLKGKLGNFTEQQDIVNSSRYKFQIEPLVYFFTSSKALFIILTKNISSLSCFKISAKWRWVSYSCTLSWAFKHFIDVIHHERQLIKK